MSDDLESLKVMPLPDGPCVIALKAGRSDILERRARALIDWFLTQGRNDIVIVIVDDLDDIQMLDERAMMAAGWSRNWINC